MAVETPEELAGFFDPQEFGQEYSADIGTGTPLVFHAIPSRAYEPQSPGVRPDISQSTPRLLAAKSEIEGLDQDHVITDPDGVEWTVYEIRTNGDIADIRLHDHG